MGAKPQLPPTPRLHNEYAPAWTPICIIQRTGIHKTGRVIYVYMWYAPNQNSKFYRLIKIRKRLIPTLPSVPASRTKVDVHYIIIYINQLTNTFFHRIQYIYSAFSMHKIQIVTDFLN